MEDQLIRRGGLLEWQLQSLRAAAMWPIKSSDNAFLRGAWTGYSWLLLGSLFIATFGLACKASLTADLVDRSEAIDILTLTLSAAFKLLYFQNNHSRFKRLVHHLEVDLPASPYIGRPSLHIKEWARLDKYLSLSHCLAGFVSISFWALCPLLKYAFHGASLTYPINVWYPFEFKEGWGFALSYALFYLALISSTQVYMAADGFCFSVLHIICGQFEILRASLKGLNQLHENITSKEPFLKRDEGLKMCVKHHAKLTSCLSDLEKLCRSLIVADVLHAIISLSFAMLQASESKGIIEWIKMTLFVLYCFFHQFLNSFFGQLVITKQLSLFDSLRQVKWVGESKQFKTTYRIMLTRSLKPIRLNAWKMYYLCYETFVEFVKAMISYYMVLRQLQEENSVWKTAP